MNENEFILFELSPLRLCIIFMSINISDILLDLMQIPTLDQTAFMFDYKSLLNKINIYWIITQILFVTHKSRDINSYQLNWLCIFVDILYCVMSFVLRYSS